MTTSQVGEPGTWTAQQVAALAPDAASLTAARKLRGRWTATGRHSDALWGLCKGSGAKPYQTVVDLSGPAYKCTCPSRKFPCKHALGLLLSWSEGEVPEAAAIADFAAEWLAGRAARAAKTAAAAPRTPSAATAEQRRARVGAGLADLDIWLGDQCRTGLAQADRSYRALEAVAARMVDAQAPGIANALRQLARNVVLRPDWPTLLLREYARLHLLATAHRHLDRLPPDLAARVRTHIGYPLTAETVRADQPPIRDNWLVLARRTTEEDRLHTRRTWLLGRVTGRWALIVDHSFGAPSFPAEAPTPGWQLDADLHFYPGSAPLRALWGERYGAPQPFTALPPVAAGEIEAALGEHARALGDDPWLRSWPVLLREVIPAAVEDRWYVAEADGTALPLTRSAEAPWGLFGLSGGHPVALIGEWTVDGLVPIAAFVASEVIDIEFEVSGGASAEAAAELVSVALLGTARRSLDPAGLPAPVAAAVAGVSGDPAEVLLETAAAWDLFERGGVSPTVVTLPEAAPEDERPLLPRAAADRLARLLSEGSPFLAEWFEAATPRAHRAPDALCALLLDHAKTRAALREPLLRLAGARGRWLAERNPQWRNLVRAEFDDPTVWSHGRPAERRAWLAALRARDPQAARTALAHSWSIEPGTARAELLAVLADRLTLDDEPLLESALDDSRADVRRLTADLLARLPESALARRMRQRAARWIVVRDGGLAVELPRTLDDAARRDGLADRTTDTPYRVDGAPDVAAEWLRRLVAATPLSHWDELFGTPQRAIAVPMTERMLGPMFAGWADAARAQRDSRWAAVLFEVLTATPTLGADLETRRELFALLPLDDRVERLRRLDASWLAEVELLVAAVPRPWPAALAEHVTGLLFDRAQLAAARPGAPGLSPASYRTLFHAAALNFPVDAAAAVWRTARRCPDPYWQNAFDQLANDLSERTTMLEELQ
ncbi:SWIM zinc finger family protein [Nocardia sp. CDC159]|uniref:SWIM zinc finger family protein n=1 Tax=Nocardia pulmonis TaxID=2951408 RepID=A0A9X2E8L4_9NOCA|nr:MULTISPECIES: SWIM zinc finger family protein [Nocardia]MCM6775759.1 SWIM zinc finger family protein [Nocardia pulmonis]MCM6788265.1 SWIM zinc finger family protein [Nocardia sp. CDC159]